MIIGAVAIGGAAGAVARFAITQLSEIREPVAILLINVTGCFAMGFLVSLVLAGSLRWPLARPMLGAGFLGGFTTFSAYAADAVSMSEDGDVVTAGVYVVVTLVLCLGAVWAGGRLGSVRRI